MDLNKILPQNVAALHGYVAGKSISEVEKEYQPSQISKLASNENRLGCSNRVKEAVLQGLSDIQDYPDPLSTKLRKRVAAFNGVSESEVLLTSGSESLISILCRTFFKNDEHAITAAATFVGFFVQAGVRGISVIKIPITDHYGFDVQAILAEINDKTKMVYIANPNNPTGTYLTKDQYQILLDGIPENVLLILDEAYYEFAESIPDYPKAIDYRMDNVIILRTFSKAYGLAGFRIGYGIANKELIQQMTKTKLTFEPTTLAQAAAIVALEDQDFIKHTVESVNQQKDELYSFFDTHSVNYVKSASNSVLMIMDNEQNAIDFTDSMLRMGVILRRVNAFGLPNCIRITVGTESEMDHFRKSLMLNKEYINS
jgi:histidinol-phosphate aminotransferase